jgi:transcriptional regulator with XRE-family HTH domain
MGDRIRKCRIVKGLTQEQLAKACRVTKSAVSQWESGTVANIRLQTFLRLLEALGTDAAYLIWGEAREPHRPPAGRRNHS